MEIGRQIIGSLPSNTCGLFSNCDSLSNTNLFKCFIYIKLHIYFQNHNDLYLYISTKNISTIDNTRHSQTGNTQTGAPPKPGHDSEIWFSRIQTTLSNRGGTPKPGHSY